MLNAPTFRMTEKTVVSAPPCVLQGPSVTMENVPQIVPSATPIALESVSICRTTGMTVELAGRPAQMRSFAFLESVPESK